MLLWLVGRAWNPFCDLQGDCLGWCGTFLSCDFGLPRIRSSSAVYSGNMDSLRPSLDTSSFSAWTIDEEWTGLRLVEPSGPTLCICMFFFFLIVVVVNIWISLFIRLYTLYLLRNTLRKFFGTGTATKILNFFRQLDTPT